MRDAWETIQESTWYAHINSWQRKQRYKSCKKTWRITFLSFLGYNYTVIVRSNQPHQPLNLSQYLPAKWWLYWLIQVLQGPEASNRITIQIQIPNANQRSTKDKIPSNTRRVSGWWFGTFLLFFHILDIIIPIN